jgi:hypothetical protein
VSSSKQTVFGVLVNALLTLLHLGPQTPRMLPSTPTRSVHVGDGSQEAAKQRALRVLKQKKLYESQRDQLYSQQFNLDQV